MSAPGALACPACGRLGRPAERFCSGCGLPLVVAGAEDPEPGRSERARRARKVQARYTEGELVRVVGTRNQTEGEFVQGMLLEEGVPSVLRRTAGFDVPDFLAAGPRDVLVPRSGWEAAREVLLEAEIASPERPRGPAPGRLLLALLVGVALVAALAWLVSAGAA